MSKLSLALIVSVLVGGVALVSMPVTAKTTTLAAKVNPWQHCGIGALIFPDHGVASAVSNIIWDLGSTAVTSATVSPDSCNTNLINVALLIDASYDQLTMETAQGSGEHLAAALNLMGCSATEKTVAVLRSDLNQVVSSAGYRDMAHQDKAYSYYSSLENVAANCSG